VKDITIEEAQKFELALQMNCKVVGFTVRLLASAQLGLPSPSGLYFV
jgi:hypothetical protein